MSKKALTLSIVIPAYNEERYLKACLDSIAAQTTKPDEVIVVDNNSTDKTVKIAKSFKFVKVLRAKKQGIVYARNLGFDSAKSDLIGRIDADTIVSKGWVKDIKDHYMKAGSPKLYVATGPSDFQNLGGRHTWYPFHRVFYFWASRFWLGHNTLSGSNMFLTRKLWLELRNKVCTRTDIHEDMDLALHIHVAGLPVVFTNDFRNSMLGRNIGHKLRNYLPMFTRIRFIKHR